MRFRPRAGRLLQSTCVYPHPQAVDSQWLAFIFIFFEDFPCFVGGPLAMSPQLQDATSNPKTPETMKTTTTTGEPIPASVPEQFLAAYITAALWSSTYETPECDDNPMDDGEHELANETRDAMLCDCAGFLNYCEETGLDPFPDYGNPSYSNLELSGHDFWLTRNGHGAGYWDRGIDTGDALTTAARTFGTADLYIGDDGLIYQY